MAALSSANPSNSYLTEERSRISPGLETSHARLTSIRSWQEEGKLAGSCWYQTTRWSVTLIHSQRESSLERTDILFTTLRTQGFGHHKPCGWKRLSAALTCNQYAEIIPLEENPKSRKKDPDSYTEMS